MLPDYEKLWTWAQRVGVPSTREKEFARGTLIALVIFAVLSGVGIFKKLEQAQDGGSPSAPTSLPAKPEQRAPVPPLATSTPQPETPTSPVCNRLREAQNSFNIGDSIHQVYLHNFLVEALGDAKKSGHSVNERLIEQARTEWSNGDRQQALRDFVEALRCE